MQSLLPRRCTPWQTDLIFELNLLGVGRTSLALFFYLQLFADNFQWILPPKPAGINKSPPNGFKLTLPDKYC